MEYHPNSYDQYRDVLRRLISDFSGQGNTLVIPRPFIDYFGNLEAALLFSQMLYWSDRSGNPDKWFWKTYSDWESELGLSEYQVRKAIKKMVGREHPLVATEIRKAMGNPTVHYRVIWDNFSESLVKFLQERTRSNFGNDGKETSGSSNRDYNRDNLQGTAAPAEVFETAVSQPSAAPTGAKRTLSQNPVKKIFTDADRERLVEKYYGQLADPGFDIDQALNHIASKKALDLVKYVDGWLRRNAQKATGGSAHGKPGGHPQEDSDGYESARAAEAAHRLWVAEHGTPTARKLH